MLRSTPLRFQVETGCRQFGVSQGVLRARNGAFLGANALDEFLERCFIGRRRQSLACELDKGCGRVRVGACVLEALRQQLEAPRCDCLRRTCSNQAQRRDDSRIAFRCADVILESLVAPAAGTLEDTLLPLDLELFLRGA